MIKKIFFFLLFLFSLNIFAQEISFEKVKREYDSFEYENVIKYSNLLLKEKSLPDTLLIDIYLMRAVSFYSLGFEDSTKESFKEILKIKNDYNADPSKISPKLITIFNQVKVDFINTLKSETVPLDSTQIFSKQKYFDYSLVRNSLIRNVFLPGSGQFYCGLKTKGSILGVLSLINLAGAVYYIYDTNKKENDYLNEVDNLLIQQKYDLYNKSYKTRNILLISYIALWVYSQLDLLFFNDNEIFMKETVESNSLMMRNGIQLSIKIRF